ADAIPRGNVYRDRIQLITSSPLDVDEPLLLALVEDVVAVGAVDGDAAAAGDVADDRVARHRVAAAGQLREQVPCAEHLHRRAVDARRRSFERRKLRLLFTLHEGCEPGGNMRGADAAVAECGEEVVERL